VLRRRARACIGDDPHVRALAECAIDAAAARAWGMIYGPQSAEGSAASPQFTPLTLTLPWSEGPASELSLSGEARSTLPVPSPLPPPPYADARAFEPGCEARSKLPLPLPSPALPKARAFELLLYHHTRSSLRLLPAPHLLFDLSAYWSNPLTARLISTDAAQQLLSSGFVVLPRLFSPEIIPWVGAEAEAHLARAAGKGGTRQSDTNTDGYATNADCYNNTNTDRYDDACADKYDAHTDNFTHSNRHNSSNANPYGTHADNYNNINTDGYDSNATRYNKINADRYNNTRADGYNNSTSDATNTDNYTNTSAVWLHSLESPPRAPPPPSTNGPIDPSLFGLSSTLGEEDVLLVRVLSALRGVCAALEEAAGLRLALPRCALYERHKRRDSVHQSGQRKKDGPKEEPGDGSAGGQGDCPMEGSGDGRVERPGESAVKGVGDSPAQGPRGCALERSGDLGDCPVEPLNTGWPDNGLEVCCLLPLCPTTHTPTFRIWDREGRVSIIAPAAGCPVLNLARSAAYRVEPSQGHTAGLEPRSDPAKSPGPFFQAEPVAGGVCGTISVFAYSAWLRTAEGLRVLGACEAVRSQLEQRPV
jgi:hypothetical protein